MTAVAVQTEVSSGSLWADVEPPKLSAGWVNCVGQQWRISANCHAVEGEFNDRCWVAQLLTDLGLNSLKMPIGNYSGTFQCFSGVVGGRCRAVVGDVSRPERPGSFIAAHMVVSCSHRSRGRGSDSTLLFSRRQLLTLPS